MKPTGYWRFAIGSWLLTTAYCSLSLLHALPPSAVSKPAPGADLFTNGAVARIRIEISSNALAALRQNSRDYVPAAVQEGDRTYQEVGVHLKGAIGSFRGLEDKPALTLNFAKFRPDQSFHGLHKIHLNNSVEDPSYLNELLGGELFRAAGVPAPRVAHALVEFNGRRLGLYVLKEGFTEDFLGQYFHRTDGALYEPGPGHDADEPLRVVSGDAAADRFELKMLAAAAREPDLQRRWQRLQQVLDVERFLSFAAVEIMVCHRDGYCLARNNFRIYHDRDSDKILFFPHGMDQLFGKADASIQPHMRGLIASAVLETPEGREGYRQRRAFLLTNIFDVPSLHQRADFLLSRLRPLLSTREARILEEEVNAVKERIVKRRRDIERQLNAPENVPLKFERGIASLTAWRVVDLPANGLMDRTNAPDGKPALRIRAGPVTSASWRAKVRLAKGSYRFEGSVCTAGVEPLKFAKSSGATVRVLGKGPRGAPLQGDQSWKPLQAAFDVTVLEEEVELLCELRASAGQAWFDLGSLRVIRVGAEPSTR